MCANFEPATQLDLEGFEIPPPDFNYGEAYPGSIAPFLANQDTTSWRAGTFGLMPHWAPGQLFRSTYNARSETAAEKPSFRNAWRRRQLCVIPVRAIYEPNYESGKAVRWRIDRADGRPFGLAGLWEERKKDDGASWYSFTMLTINADEHPFMRQFHKPGDEKRSVVVLPDDQWETWLKAKDDTAIRRMLNDFDPKIMQGKPAPIDRKPKLNKA